MFKKILKNHHGKFVLFLSFAFLIFVMKGPLAEVIDPANGGLLGISGQEPDFSSTGTMNLASLDIGGELKRAAKKAEDAFKKIRSDGLSFSKGPGVQGLAKILLFTFGTIAIVFPALKIALGGGERAMEEFLMALLTVGVFSAFSVGGSYDRLATALSDMMTDLGQSVLGPDPNMIGMMGDILKGVIDSFKKNLPNNLVQFLTDISYTVMVIVIGFLAIVGMIIAFFFITIYINIGNILMAIALALGPIFIACGVWKVTREFFSKWLNFLLIAGMYDVVAKLILRLMKDTGFLSTVVPADGVQAVASMFFALFTIATLAWISHLIPQIANALLPGQIGGMTVSGPRGSGKRKDDTPPPPLPSPPSTPVTNP